MYLVHFWRIIFSSCVCIHECSRPAVALVRKLIAVLESIERLPLHLYDTPGSSYNLQVSFHLSLERGQPSSSPSRRAFVCTRSWREGCVSVWSERLEKPLWSTGRAACWRWSRSPPWSPWSSTCWKWWGRYGNRELSPHQPSFISSSSVRQVAKQWYDFERSSFVFVRKLREGQIFTFRHQHDFDENGIIYWVGTNAK